jgi:tetratricopeptide (TPR) repeat protein
MKFSRSRSRGAVLTRKALATVLAIGLAGGTLGASSAMAAPAATYSKEFAAVAGPFQPALEKARKSKDPADIAALVKQIGPVLAAVKTADDKEVGGQFAFVVGSLADDQALQRKGLQLRVEGGKLPADAVAPVHFTLGYLAFVAKDNDVAAKELETAIADGYNQPQGYVILGWTYSTQGKYAEAIKMLSKGIDLAGPAAEQPWYGAALSAAYKLKDFPSAIRLSAQLVRAYPSKSTWHDAIAVVRDLGQLPSQDTLDLLRLWVATDSFGGEGDYGEFVQNADARRNPGEVKALLERGIAAKQVDPTKPIFADALRISSARVAADRASLPGLEKDARLPNATATNITGAADAFLSYTEGAKAADLYKLALAKPGVDKPVVLTRLGIALFYAGDYAGAKAAFAQVEGVRQGTALLWSTYADQKAAGK